MKPPPGIGAVQAPKRRGAAAGLTAASREGSHVSGGTACDASAMCSLLRVALLMDRFFFLSKAGWTSGRKKAARQCKVGSPIGPKSVQFRRDKGPKSVADVAQKEQQHVVIGTQQVGKSETRKKWFAASRTYHVVSSNERVPSRK